MLSYPTPRPRGKNRPPTPMPSPPIAGHHIQCTWRCSNISSNAYIMRLIGTAAGLRGVATWKTQIVRRFNESLFRSSDPDRYQELLERYYRLDTPAWKSARPEEYKSIQTTYFTPQITRAFRPEK